MNRRRISLALAVLLLMGLVANWRLVFWVFRIGDPLGLLIGITWLLLVLATVVGLASSRRWGAFGLLLLAPFSTVLLASPLFPGMQLVGLRGPLALALWNLVALLSGVAILRIPHVPERNQTS